MDTPLQKLVRLSVGDGERNVASPEGMKKYKKPIGARITAADIAKSARPDRSSISKVTVSTPKQKTYGPHNRAPVDLTKTSAMRQSKINARTYSRHAKFLNDTIDKLWDTEATHKRYATNGGRGNDWLPERAALHKQIVDDLWNDAANVPNEGKALFSGGLSGAGKTTVLEQYAGVDLERYLVINVDDIKEIMAKRGMIPEIKGMSPMEASSLGHVEAAHIAALLLDRAKRDKKNVLRDVTMAGAGNGATTAKARVQELIDEGYRVDALFVDIPVDLSVERVLSRHKKGMEDYEQGKGLGGRFVPLGVVRENAPPEGSPYLSSNRHVFEDLKPLFKDWRLYDNSLNGHTPELVDGTPGFEGSVGNAELARQKREEKQRKSRGGTDGVTGETALSNSARLDIQLFTVRAIARRKVDAGPLF